jgi:hypothetical protein
MFTQRSSAPVSRRAALAGLGAGGAGLAVAASARSVHAEGASMAEHPLAGAWLVSISPGMATALCTLDKDGTALVAVPICEDNGSGAVSYTTPGIGTWQSEGSRGGYVNVVQVLSHATGALIGTRSTHYFPVISEDGKSFTAEGRFTRVVVRDSTGALIKVMGEDGELPEISGVRMSPGSPGFPGPAGSPAEL